MNDEMRAWESAGLEGWDHGPPARTANIANVIRGHWHGGAGRFHWKRLVLSALFLLDEFFCGRFWRVCDLRTRLESKWYEYWE